MSSYLGDFRTGKTVRKMWNSNAVAGESITRATNGTISVYKDGGTTQSTSGVTDTEDFDSLTGVHLVAVDTSADGTFYSAGSDFEVVLSAATIDGKTINATLFSFSLENRSGLMPTTDGRKLDVSAGGEAGVDWANVGSPTTAVGLSGTTVKTATDVETDTADIQSRLPAALVSGRIDASVGAMAANTLTATAIASDAITAAKIADGAIDANTFAASAITATAIASDAITAAKIADGAIDAATFAAGAITATVIATDAIDADALADGAITSGVFAANSITATAIAADAITDAKVASDVTIASVTGAVGSVTGNVGGNVTGTIGGLTAAALKDFFDTDSVTTYASAVAGSVVKEIADNAGGSSLTASDIADEVQTRTIAAVTLVNGLAANTVTASALAADAVTEIANGLLDLANGVETDRTVRQILRGAAAALLGQASGLETTTAVYRDTNDTTDRITATVDADGNRTAVTLDLT